MLGFLCISILVVDGQYCLCVEDSGFGLFVSDVQCIFDVFQCGFCIGDMVVKGSGLGLVVVWVIVSVYYGMVDCCFLGMGGSCFELCWFG